MTDMEELKFLSEFAFPCIVTLIVLGKIDNTLSKLNNNIIELSSIIKSIKLSS